MQKHCKWSFLLKTILKQISRIFTLYDLHILQNKWDCHFVWEFSVLWLYSSSYYFSVMQDVETVLFVCFLFYVPFASISFIWRCHHWRRRAAKFRSPLGTLSREDLYRATPAVKQGLGFCGLFRRTALINRPWCQASILRISKRRIYKLKVETFKVTREIL